VVRETHISTILLTGPYAYKVKKPVTFEFLDFSTLEQREYYCQKELELNRRLCPDLYQSVIPIGGQVDEPKLGNQDPVLDYAVKMVQFSEENLLSRLADRDELDRRLIDKLTNEIVNFHQNIETSPPAGAGTVEEIREDALNNFEPFHNKYSDECFRKNVQPLKNWTIQKVNELKETFRHRRDNGFVRHGHGDMHLGNMVQIDDQIKIFDCIEFNDNFRWIDVMNEIGFLLMDLRHRQQDQLANRLRNRYATETGDFEGLKILRFYLVYRAMVRAKVNLLDDCRSAAERHLTTANRFLEHADPILILTHGFSGSGKTTFTEGTVDRLGAIRVRSDVERKRIAGISPTESPDPTRIDDVYSAEMTKKTYERLATLSENVLRAGYPVIVDATFLKEYYRSLFAELADELGVRMKILDFDYGEETLRERLRSRNNEDGIVSDAGVEVLEEQIQLADPLTEQERERTLRLDDETDESSVQRCLEELLN
jgi:aminoglycoside phosphotransferase family enzyme/predicted kinase